MKQADINEQRYPRNLEDSESFRSARPGTTGSGDERLVRLGYLLPLTIWMANLPGWGAIMLGNELDADTVPMFGHSAPEVLDAWLKAEDFLMPRVDEARALIHELNLG